MPQILPLRILDRPANSNTVFVKECSQLEKMRVPKNSRSSHCGT